ncbi:hypothetical protein ACQB60_40690 [Actinomycetota bacterium Odt1-20B]
MAVSAPFSGSGPSVAKYRWEVFQGEGQARADLQQLLDEGTYPGDGGKAAEVLRRAEGGEVLLIANTSWAFGLYRVQEGETAAGAGCSFYDGLVVTMEKDHGLLRNVRGAAIDGQAPLFYWSDARGGFVLG